MAAVYFSASQPQTGLDSREWLQYKPSDLACAEHGGIQMTTRRWLGSALLAAVWLVAEAGVTVDPIVTSSSRAVAGQGANYR